MNETEQYEYYLHANQLKKMKKAEISTFNLSKELNVKCPIPKEILHTLLKKCTETIYECDADHYEDSINTASTPEENEGILAISWSAQLTDVGGMHRTAYGLTHFPIEKLPKLMDEDELLKEVLGVTTLSKIHEDVDDYQQRQEMTELEKRQKKVKYSCEFKSNVVQHDYNKSKICVVPIVINIASFSPDKLKAKIELLDQTYSRKSKWTHKWIGHTKPLECTLEPYGSCKLELQIAFSTHGMFDISNFFELYCCDLDESKNKSPFTLQTYKGVEFLSIVGSFMPNCTKKLTHNEE